MGELDIELGGLERAFGLHLGGVGRLQGLAALVDDGIGHGLGLVQGQGAIEFALGKLRLCPRIGQLAVGLLGDRLERDGRRSRRADRRPDDGAVAELDAGHETADAGANLDFLNRLETSGEFIPVGDGAFHRLGHRHGRRRRGRRLRRLVAAGSQRKREPPGSTI